MKKILCTLLAMCILLSFALPFASAESTARVEISFRVGDSTLKINGVDVKVETPYVVGEGVTLVPLRVITEAFGATVGWNGETKTVTLDYPGVNIILQIDNPVAEVNGRIETLLAAPELTNNTTMVPLRFISETFGATVSYDNETAEIKVVKEAVDNTPTLESGITSAFIGDSYYGWSMETPQSFEMTQRDFNGIKTTFVYDKNNRFELNITALYENVFNFNAECINTKAKLGGDTTTIYDKNPDAKTMHVQKTDKTSTYEMYMHANDDFKFVLHGKFENDKPHLRDEAQRVMATFCLPYSEEALDLSNVKDGWRLFENKDMQLTMHIPEDYHMTSDTLAYNEFTFAPASPNDTISKIHAEVLSKSETLNAQTLCTQDYAHNQAYFNPKYANFSNIEQVQYEHINVYEYDYTILGFEEPRYVKDVFWESGDYIFNVAITLKRPHTNPEGYANKILARIQTGTPDTTQVGTLLRNDLLTEDTKALANGNWSLEMPLYYTATHSNLYAVLKDPTTGAKLTYYYYENGLENRTLQSRVSSLGSVSAEILLAKIQNTMKVEDGDFTYLYTEVSEKAEDKNPIRRITIGKEDGKHAHILVVEVPEQYRSDSLYNLAVMILKSAKSK